MAAFPDLADKPSAEPPDPHKVGRGPLDCRSGGQSAKDLQNAARTALGPGAVKRFRAREPKHGLSANPTRQGKGGWGQVDPSTFPIRTVLW
jgi:hypothetical protein